MYTLCVYACQKEYWKHYYRNGKLRTAIRKRIMAY